MSQELIERLERAKAGPVYSVGCNTHYSHPLMPNYGGSVVGPTEFEHVVIDALIELLRAKAPSAPPQRVHVQTVGQCEWDDHHQCYMPTDGRYTAAFSTGN